MFLSPLLAQLLPEIPENGTLSVRVTHLSTPQSNSRSHMVLPPFQTLLRDTVLYPTPTTEPNHRHLSGVLVYLAWAADRFENHRIFPHLGRDLQRTRLESILITHLF
jgi:hypothetical protein